MTFRSCGKSVLLHVWYQTNKTGAQLSVQYEAEPNCNDLQRAR